MTRKSFGKAGLKCFVCLLLSILAGILLMTCVYILPTGRMLTQADRSLPIFENEGTSFCWAPEEKSARLDGFTDAIMMQIAVYIRDADPLKAAMQNDRMEFTEGKLDPAGSLKQYVYGNRSGYVVSYALSIVCAQQLKAAYDADPVDGWARYHALCASGGSKLYAETLAEAGLPLPYAPGVVEALAQTLQHQPTP